MKNTLSLWGLGALLASSLLATDAAAQAGITPITF